jgi:GT2 family glycosyltransferase
VTPRPRVDGKFLAVGPDRFYVRGVTYGTFRPRPDDVPYPTRSTVARDFAAMVVNGVNTVRVYTAPPTWLLDEARDRGLRVLVGLPWEQHVAFLDNRVGAARIAERVAAAAAACAGHPALLAYAIGNEIPAGVVRWHGRKPVERFLRRLADAVRDVDPLGLVTYANYPSTEYLDLPFLDIVAFNVFLERDGELQRYLARLQTVAGDRPLVLTELGLDSGRHGEVLQRTAIGAQLETAYRTGCAGAVVFSWTDEWHTGGHEIDEWNFGLVDRERRPKLALGAARRAFSGPPVPTRGAAPRVTVAVCTHNGAATLADCLDGIASIEYPDFETIVVDDGSTDDTAEIAARYGVQLISTENRGLSAARNTALAAATGEVVAYIDDDARPDPMWLCYLVETLVTSAHAGVGGPNLAPRTTDTIETAVGRTPGGPTHILLSDTEAEHIPGCNMAFWRESLLDVGGFDPRFRVAGDDVDICWKLQAAGRTLGFSPAAVVWHRRRASIRAFLRQQRGYGRAEALLERVWPEKYTLHGQVRWRGRIYADGSRAGRWHVYHGTWGSGSFQQLHERGRRPASLLLTPEWWAATLALALAGAYEVLVAPLLPSLGAAPLSAFIATGSVGAIGVSGVVAARAAARDLPACNRLLRGGRGLRVQAATTLLTALQPLARLVGRLESGLTPWRSFRAVRLVLPWRRSLTSWTEEWESFVGRLERIESALRARPTAVERGGAYDRWDLEARVGTLGSARLRATVEEHGQGRQQFRFRVWPRLSRAWALSLVALSALASLSWTAGGVASAAPLAAVAVLICWRGLRDAAGARDAVSASLAEVDHARDDVAARRASLRPRPVASYAVPGTEESVA